MNFLSSNSFSTFISALFAFLSAFSKSAMILLRCHLASRKYVVSLTIECASDTKEPYAFNDAVYKALIELCIDICKRHKKQKLLWLGSKVVTLKYEPKPDEMVLTVHRWFANKSCPGDWLYERLGDLAAKVTAGLNVFYRVRKSWDEPETQIGAFASIENARAALRDGYHVYDENGREVL